MSTHYGLDGPGSNPDGATFSAHVQTGTGAHLASSAVGTASISPGGYSGRDVALITNSHLAPRLMKE